MSLMTPIRRGSAFIAAIMVAACGGGGGSDTANPTVTSLNAGTAKYSDKLLITVSGSALDTGLVLTSAGCTGMALSTTAPNVSNASTAYYTCTVAAVGLQLVTASRSSDGAALDSAAFTVPIPQVTLTVSNGTNTTPATYTGAMVFTLAPDKAPITVDNFLRYVKDAFYANTVFHRVVTNPVPFVIQGGGYRVDAPRGLLPPITLEVNRGLSNVQWSIAMARTADPNSATSQFFVNLGDNSASLDPHPALGSDPGLGYAVFGTVSTGRDVVSAVSTAPCAPLAGITSGTECTPQPYMVVTSAVQTQ